MHFLITENVAVCLYITSTVDRDSHAGVCVEFAPGVGGVGWGGWEEERGGARGVGRGGGGEEKREETRRYRRENGTTTEKPTSVETRSLDRVPSRHLSELFRTTRPSVIVYCMVRDEMQTGAGRVSRRAKWIRGLPTPTPTTQLP